MFTTPIRTRLALWYGTLLSVVLVAFAVTVYLLLQAHLYAQLDQALQRQSTHMVEYLTSLQGRPGETRSSLLAKAVQAFDSPDIYTEILSMNHNLLGISGAISNARVPVSEWALGLVSQDQVAMYNTFVDLSKPARRVHLRVRLQAVDFAPGTGRSEKLLLITAASQSPIHDILDQLLWVSLWLGVAAVAIAIGTGWALAGTVLRPIAAITETARAIARSGRFGRKLYAPQGKDELAHLSRTFNEMLESLEASFRSQKRFVADASHELRAPLTTIQGNLDLLAEPGAVPEGERQTVLADIRSETGRLARLVKDLLNLAHADVGVPLNLSWIELDRLVVEVVRPYAKQATDRTLGIERLEPARIHVDGDRLAQLLVILLDNSLQYTHAGDTIKVSAWADDEVAILQVSDTGVGIAEEHLPHVFERFYRADASRTRESGGTGLGLAIAEQIVEAHHGSIKVQSELGEGTTFTVTLPKTSLQSAG